MLGFGVSLCEVCGVLLDFRVWCSKKDLKAKAQHSRHPTTSPKCVFIIVGEFDIVNT